MTGIKQKSSVAALPLCSLHKHNSWVKKLLAKNNKKNIVRISIIAY